MGKSISWYSNKTISSAVGRNTYGGHSKLKTKRSFYLQPKQQLFAKLNAKKLKFLKRIKENNCSSEKEHKVNALALRADEGRDYLR